MQLPEDWRRYVAPAAFLLAVTIAVLLVHSGLESTSSAPATASTAGAGPPTIQAGDTTTTTPTPAKRFWTVKAGDTFAVISAHTGVPVATIEHLNPTVKSTALFIGEKVRIK